MIWHRLFEAVQMPVSEYARKRDLECLRLASDLTRLANRNVGPILRSHFRRMAKVWTSLAEFGPGANTATRF
jgi:hypothetical protein